MNLIPDEIKKIKKWLEVADSIELSGDSKTNAVAYPKFAMVWMVFNFIYNKFTGNVNGDKKRMEKFSKDSFVEEVHKRLLEKISNYKNKLNKLAEELKRKELKDLKNGDTKKIKDVSNFNEIIEVIYTIRNNLFHGDKTGSFTERDRELCLYSYNILKIFIEEYMKNQGE